MPDCAKNFAKGRSLEHDEVPAPVVANYGGLVLRKCKITSIRLGPKLSSHAGDEGSNVRHLLYPS